MAFLRLHVYSKWDNPKIESLHHPRCKSDTHSTCQAQAGTCFTISQPNIKFSHPVNGQLGSCQLPFHSESCGWHHYQSKSNPGKQVHCYCQTKGRVPIICAAQMPPGSHQPRSTPSRPVGSDLLHGSLPLHVFLLPLNGCCPWWSLSLEPFILVGSSSLSLCSLHLHVTLQFLAREHEVTWLLAVVAKLLSTLSTLACAQCECHWLALLHGMQPPCHCLALHQDPLVEAHCMQLCHGLLPHALLRVLHMQMCLDQQPTLCTRTDGCNPWRKQSRTSAGAVSCMWSSLQWKLST